MLGRGAARRWIVLALVTMLVTALGASVASAASSSAVTPPKDVSMEGTGAQPPGLGMFSKAALSQKGCSTEGRTTSTYEGGGPFCVNPWPKGKNNGGATAQGVTATQVQVVAYLPNDQMSATDSSQINQASGKKANIADVYADWLKAYQSVTDQYGTYQLWGRTPVIDPVIASGDDEASQRADALTVLAKKPFMVVDMTKTAEGGAPVFSSLIAAKKIITVSASTDAQASTQQAPYRWNYGADPSAGPTLTAGLVGKSLTGKKAEWAGDSSLKSKTRAFGAIYPTTGFDLASFEKYLTQNGGKLTDKVSYDPTSTGAAAQVSTQVSHLKAAGVTSVILFATPTVVTTIMAAATDQQYSPEWIFTGTGYQEYDGFARANDQQQMAHAFGVGALGPATTGAPTGLGIFPWYWGTSQGNTTATASGLFSFLYNAMHYAGPTLTAKNVQLGLFAAPATDAGGAVFGYGKTVGLPYDEYSLFGASAYLLWYDATTTGPAQATLGVAKGLFQYADKGASVLYSGLTKTAPKYFDASDSIYQRTAAELYPNGVAPVALPCTGCPSSGAAPSSS